MRKPSIYSYTGTLDVEGGDFDLEAERLILLKDRVTFRLIGNDEDGEFSVEGTAVRKPEGIYFSPHVPMSYKHFPDVTAVASIEFTAVRQTPKKTKCKINGVWESPGVGPWLFSGTLRRFKAGK